jgi:uncharacterized repeat protein (TIGR03847 family)
VNNQRLDLGGVDDVHVESFGEPGQRTFRIHVQKGSGTVSLWLEKYQVTLLGSAIEELLERVSASNRPASTDSGSTFLGELEVRAGELSLAYNEERNAFTLEAGEFESAFDLETITFQADRGQIEGVQGEIEKIVAASRPRCVLCGTPLTGEPHFCPGQNGHAKLKVDEPS